LDGGAPPPSEASLIERDRAALRRALILGTSRRPIDVPAWLADDSAKARELALVAALGLRTRFDRPAPPPRLGTAGFEHDPDRLLSDTARAALRRLYGAKRRAVPRSVSLRIVDALHARRISLHPFDYLALT